MQGTIPIINVSIWFIAKIFVIVALLIYSAFAFVISKQTQMMINTVKVGFEAPLKMIVLLHLAAVVFVLLASLVIL
jgi:hypothetical protein